MSEAPDELEVFLEKAWSDGLPVVTPTLPRPVDPDDDAFVHAIQDASDLHLIVAGGWGPCTAICHGWSGGSRSVHGRYTP